MIITILTTDKGRHFGRRKPIKVGAQNNTGYIKLFLLHTVLLLTNTEYMAITISLDRIQMALQTTKTISVFHSQFGSLFFPLHARSTLSFAPDNKKQA